MNRVLVVDDSPDILLLCRVHLEYEGFVVATAESGREAIEQIARARPDVVVLDVMMPVMDGWDVLAVIRSEPSTVDIPVVMLTARGEGPDEIRGWREGASAYMTKPFIPTVLAQTVTKVLERSPVQASRMRDEMLGKLEFARRLAGEPSAPTIESSP